MKKRRHHSPKAKSPGRTAGKFSVDPKQVWTAPATTTPVRSPAPIFASWWRRPDFLIGTLIGMAGLILGTFALSPRIGISVTQSTVSKDPLAATFTLQNESFYSIRDVNLSFVLCEVSALSYDIPLRKCNLKTATRFTKAEWSKLTLLPDEHYDLEFADLIQPAKNVIWRFAQIGLMVEYTPYWFPFPMTKFFRMTTVRDEDNKIEWVFRPSELATDR